MKDYIILLDEQGFYRLLKKDDKGEYSIVVNKTTASNKEEAIKKFQLNDDLPIRDKISGGCN